MRRNTEKDFPAERKQEDKDEKLMPVYQLFPEPVYFSKLERSLTKKELGTLNKYKKKTYKNDGNMISRDNHVLDHKALGNLKKDLDKRVTDYFNKIVCTSNSITPYITQSWINYTQTNQFHPRHAHPNSYISGVFYINAQKGNDEIEFYKTGYERLLLQVSQLNPFNSSSWKYPVETGDVLLFSSSLQHGVDNKKGDNTRTSLSFNVFIKGKIGDNAKLTELVLK